MKLVRFGPAGKEKPGLIDADGKLRDLSKKVKDIDGATLAPASLKALAKLDTKKLPLVADPNYLYKELFEANNAWKDMAKEVDDSGEEQLAAYNAFKAVTGLGDPIMSRLR